LECFSTARLDLADCQSQAVELYRLTAMQAVLSGQDLIDDHLSGRRKISLPDLRCHRKVRRDLERHQPG
jgi:hypothetical protein